MPVRRRLIIMEFARNKNNLTREEIRAWREQCKKQKPFTDRMIHYNKLVDNSIKKRMINKPEHWDRTVTQEWLLKVKPVANRLPTIDYDNNILFVCNEKIMRETFFAAFYKLGLLVDYRFLDLISARELWYHDTHSFSICMLEDINSFRDIKEDVLCSYLSSGMGEVESVPEIWTSVISSRSSNQGVVTKNQNTWIFFEGTLNFLECTIYADWVEFFKKNGIIIDLNPKVAPCDFNALPLY